MLNYFNCKSTGSSTVITVALFTPFCSLKENCSIHSFGLDKCFRSLLSIFIDMAKTKTVYICQSCGYQSAKWAGRCSSCSEWNTFVEETVSAIPEKAKAAASLKDAAAPQNIHELEVLQTFRIVTKDEELNRVLGGGIVPGSLILIGGEPGIGKSTLMLQIALSFDDVKVLYVSGEESTEQIGLRAQRDRKSVV